MPGAKAGSGKSKFQHVEPPAQDRRGPCIADDLSTRSVAGAGRQEPQETDMDALEVNENTETEPTPRGQCPVMHGATIASNAAMRSNRDWWPNQLNLKILHQNSALSSPMGEAS